MPIMIPDKINVGFQNRQGTYTGKLAYVIYYDNKGKLRKETSWQSWRDEKIPNEEFENIPTEGFVLNKKVGGYDTGWNHRNTYTRVYDPRGFEFEINIENLLFILEHCNSIKGKGLEGEFVYAWDGKELVLLPVDSPDYKDIRSINDKIKNKKRFTMKNVKLGARYLTKNNEEVIYMGRYNLDGDEKNKKEYFLYYPNKEWGCSWWSKEPKFNVYRFSTVKTLGSILIDCIDEECDINYSDIYENMQHYESFSAYDETKDEYCPHTSESFARYILSHYNDNPDDYNSYGRHEEIGKSMSITYYLSDRKISYNHDIGSYHNYNWKDNMQTTLHKYNDKHKFYTEFYAKTNRFHWTIETREDNPEYTQFYRSYWGDKPQYINQTKTKESCTIQEFVEKYKPQYKKEYLKNGKIRRVLCYDKK